MPARSVDLRSTLYPFTDGTLEETVASGFADFDFGTRLASAETVFIKPNLVTDVPQYIRNGANTDVRIIEAVIAVLSDYDVEIVLGESDTGTETKGRTVERALEQLEISDLQSSYEFRIVNLTADDRRSVPIPDGTHLSEIELAETFLESDLILNLPTVKTHKYGTITCALKNMFGVVPDPLRIVYHEDIHRVLRDLNTLFHDRMFTVIDGIRGMEGNGPLYGTPVDLECLAFAAHPIAADLTACRLMQVDPASVRHLALFCAYAGVTEPRPDVGGPLDVDAVSRPFTPANKNTFVTIEGKLMQHRPIVRFFFNDWVRTHLTYHLNPLLSRLRGGSYRWHLDEEE